MPQRDLLIVVGAKADAYFKEFDKMQKQTANLEKSLVAVGQVSGVAFAGLALTTGLAVKSFADFETNLVGVGKTTGLAGEELLSLGSELKALSKEIPVSANELLNIGQVAGQLGVQGAENINKFSDTIAKLGRASDLEGERAATVLTRILNVTNENISTIDTFASVIVALGNNFAATESEIALVTNEIARSTAVFDIGSAKAAGLATALRSIGVRAELAGTVVGKSFRAIDAAIRGGGEKMEQLKKMTGLTGDELEKTFKEDATKVFQLFVEGLGKMQAGGGSAAVELQKMGLIGEGVLKVLPALAGNSALLGRTLAVAAKETENATALEKEFAAASLTLNSDILLLKNSTNSLFIGIGDDLEPAVSLLVNTLTGAVQGIEGLNEATGGGLSNVLAIATGLTGLTTGLAFTTVGIIKFTRAVKASTIATGFFNVALRALPFLAVAAAVILLRDKLISLGSQIIDVKNEQKAMEASNLGIIAQHREQIKNFKKLGDQEIEFAGRTMKASDAVKILEQSIEGLTQKEIDRIKAKREAKTEEAAEIIAVAPEDSPEVLAEKEKQILLEEIQAEFKDKQREEKKAALEEEFLFEQMSAEQREVFLRERAQKELDIERQTEAARATILSKGFSNLATLMNTGNKELFAIGKAAAIAGALIDTYSSAQSLFAGALKTFAFLGPGALPLAGALAGTAVVAGLVRVANIASTQFTPAQEGAAGGRGGFGDSVPRLTSPREIIVPPAFSEGIRRGDLSLTGAGRGGGVNIDIAITTGNIYGEGGIVQLTEDIRKATQQSIVDSGAVLGDTS